MRAVAGIAHARPADNRPQRIGWRCKRLPSGGPCAEYLSSLDALFDLEVLGPASSSCSCEHRQRAAKAKELSAKAKKLERQMAETIRQLASEVREMRRLPAKSVDNLGPVAVEIPVPSRTLVDLARRGVFDDRFVLVCDIGDFHAGWRMLAGGCLKRFACSDTLHVADDSHEEVREVLVGQAQMLLLSATGLAVQGDTVCNLWFKVPMLDTVLHYMAEFRRWQIRNARWQAQQRVDAHSQGRVYFEASFMKEKQRLQSAAGFDVAEGSTLAPPHLEKRVHWSEYRNAARLQKIHTRRQESRLRRAWALKVPGEHGGGQAGGP